MIILSKKGDKAMDTRKLIIRNVEYITPGEVANILNIKRETILSWIKRNSFEVPHVRIGARYFFKKKDIDAFIDNIVNN